MAAARPRSIALVHDYLVDAGGAERVVAAFCRAFPGAPLYTSLYDPCTTNPAIPGDRVRTSFLQGIYPGTRYYQALLPLFPLAFRRLEVPACVVLSSASAFAKGVRVAPGAVHVCYCHTPPRFAWLVQSYARQQGWGPVRRGMLAGAAVLLRRWDRAAAGRVDYFIANSQATAQRIWAAYGRRAAVIPPPVDLDRFVPLTAPSSASSAPYFLMASRLIGYKRADLAVVACTRAGLPLKVAGTGPDVPRLRRLAGPTVQFLGRVSDEELGRLYAGCTALLQPGEEDYGMTPLEANAAGRPAIAYRAGGAVETVRDGKTGRLFFPQTAAALEEALRTFQAEQFEPSVLRAHAATFGTAVFERRIRAFIAFAHQRGPSPAPDDDWLPAWQVLDAELMPDHAFEPAGRGASGVAVPSDR